MSPYRHSPIAIGLDSVDRAEVVEYIVGSWKLNLVVVVPRLE
jgi:hypothetical protein